MESKVNMYRISGRQIEFHLKPYIRWMGRWVNNSGSTHNTSVQLQLCKFVNYKYSCMCVHNSAFPTHSLTPYIDGHGRPVDLITGHTSSYDHRLYSGRLIPAGYVQLASFDAKPPAGHTKPCDKSLCVISTNSVHQASRHTEHVADERSCHRAAANYDGTDTRCCTARSLSCQSSRERPDEQR
jgi:hypothetical protein